ncbi:hypothetical protein ACFS7Z_22190 [Pontibacter toksunensis]|uniref:Uncharacterized protein n=1 Tax=Pontibacter toksunensis TaxID=1332631 RepID=A0ABW6BZ57_9BACT
MNLYVETLAIAQYTLAAVNPSQASVTGVDSLVMSKQALKAIIEATKDEPSWTDKAQAYTTMFGTLVAIVTGVLAWFSYRSTIKQQQDQINDQQKELDSLAMIARGVIS